LSRVNDALGAGFESEEVETIGGLVLERLNRTPEVGDSVEIVGHVAEVTSVEGARIVTVQIHERGTDEPPEERE
jgi:CBS domain containing-hemolysin-like protein